MTAIPQSPEEGQLNLVVVVGEREREAKESLLRPEAFFSSLLFLGFPHDVLNLNALID